MKNVFKVSAKISAICLLAITLVRCAGDNQSTTVYDTTSAEVAGETISGVAAQSDDSSGTNVAALTIRPKTINQQLAELIFPQANATASCLLTPSAKIKANTGGCTGADMTLDLAGCTVAAGLFTWSGSMALTFSSAGVCTQADASGLLGMSAGGGDSVNIQSSAGITRTGPLGSYLVTDSNASGYAAPQLSGGLTVTCVDSGCGNGTGGSSRTVSIAGIHRATYTMRGLKVFDHTLSTSTDFTINGTGAARTISAGTLVLEHNILQYTATTNITTPLTFSAGCCWPTGGAATTTFSNGKTGTETLTFGPSCGDGNVNGTSFSFQVCN